MPGLPWRLQGCNPKPGQYGYPDRLGAVSELEEVGQRADIFLAGMLE
jgi:hypothetical protein